MSYLKENNNKYELNENSNNISDENSEENSNKLIIGITGSYSSGKSTVSNIIRNLGYEVLDTDLLAKDLINSDKNIQSKISEKFGAEIFNESGILIREKLASLVFGDDEISQKRLLELNSIVHPRTIEEMIRWTEERIENNNYNNKYNKNLIFIESAILFESELEDGFDHIIFIDTKLDIILNRVAADNQELKNKILNRINSQMSADEKRSHSDFVIDNSGDLIKLNSSVNFIINLLESMI